MTRGVGCQGTMKMSKVVNLDALIQREDFLATKGVDEAGLGGKSEITLTDLTKGASFFLTLRKPDFQRETAAWTPEAVRDFIKAFIDGDLIPAVICWQSPQRLSFVIDGAHRLSAVIAWLLDDYGDGTESVKFYGNKIPDEQRRIAKRTKELVDDEIGAYAAYKAETENPNSNPKLTAGARALAFSKIPLLWIRGSDSTKAERAFLTINRSAVEIDQTELKILNSRFKPNAIASRAIVRNATGHKYWKVFSETAQQELEATAREINSALYSPPLVTPIKSLDLPIAGHGYGSQTLPLIFDFVNIANGLPVLDASRSKVKRQSQKTEIKHDPPDEGATLEVMRRAAKLTRRMTGVHPSSLGLHPAVYFYAANGRHQPTAVLAMAALIVDLIEEDKLIAFTLARAAFETFLIEHKFFVNQLTTQTGSMAKGYRQLRDYLRFVLDRIIASKPAEEILADFAGHETLRKLVNQQPIKSTQSKPFSQDLKQWAFLHEALSKSFECALCKARMDTKSMQLHHDVELSKGGLGSGDNAKWTHPFCNSTYALYIG